MRRPNQSDENTEVEFRVVEVRVRGGSAAVIDSLRTMAGAFSARPKQLPPRGISAAVTEKENDSPQEELNLGDRAAPEPMPMAEGSSRTQRPRAPKKPAVAPEILTGLDVNNGKPTFEEFFASIGEPDEDRVRYLAAAYWLKRHYATPITSITAQHPFTIYRLMKWGVPKDASVPLLDATRKNQWFMKDDKGWAISNVGESAIEKRITKKK